MSMDDLNIPNNFRLLHVQTKDGDELVRIIWVKINWLKFSQMGIQTKI